MKQNFKKLPHEIMCKLWEMKEMAGAAVGSNESVSSHSLTDAYKLSCLNLFAAVSLKCKVTLKGNNKA